MMMALDGRTVGPCMYARDLAIQQRLPDQPTPDEARSSLGPSYPPSGWMASWMWLVIAALMGVVYLSIKRWGYRFSRRK
jgi:hypothetical protein